MSFVLGYYSKYDDSHIRVLLNGMTHSEKIDILSLNYEQLWYRVMLDVPKYMDINADRVSKSDINAFIKKKKRFEYLFMCDNGYKLRSLINHTNNNGLLWEIPKGRKYKNELTLDCAIREFKEETGLKSSHYTVLCGIKPIVESYISMKTTYINKYFISSTTLQTSTHIKFSNTNQITEIEDMRWMNTDDVRRIDTTDRLYKLVARIIKIYKKQCKSNIGGIL